MSWTGECAEKARKEEEEAKEERKRKAAAEKLWEDSRDTRVQDWRSFMNGGMRRACSTMLFFATPSKRVFSSRCGRFDLACFYDC